MLPPADRDIPPASGSPQREAAPAAYREVVGAIHIHTTASDGRLPLEEVVRVAERQGLDFLIFTDHNTLRPRKEGKEGRHGRVLALIGQEISTSSGHLLALRTAEEIPPRKEGQKTINRVAEQGGLSFIAHPLRKRMPWTAPDARGFKGMEIYNASDDAWDENPLQVIFWTLAAGSGHSIIRWLDRPEKPLELWDRYLSEGRKIVGIGGADAHGLRWMGMRLAPYDTVFKLVRNHLLVRGEMTPESVWDALENGRLFVAHDLVADARGFRFSAVRGGVVAGVMGDRVRWSPGLELHASLPGEGKMVLFKDGRAVAKGEGQWKKFPLDGPGIYRLEVSRKGQPWIYSNPIVVIK